MSSATSSPSSLLPDGKCALLLLRSVKLSPPRSVDAHMICHNPSDINDETDNAINARCKRNNESDENGMIVKRMKM